MNSANPPLKHHYIPAFYLRRWAVDGMVMQFMKVHGGEIKPLPRAPEATGFENRLYEMKGHDPAVAQMFEELYFKPLDTKAAEALEMLYRHGHLAPWTSESRTDWTRFMLSLLLRCPEDIKRFREWWSEDFGRTDPETEATYLAQRQPGAPETFSEFLVGQPERVREATMFKMLNTLLEGESVGTHINQMHWRVLRTPDSAPLLLTSDRPVIRTNGLDSAGSHIALPIGPRFLFLASHDTEFLQGILKANQTALVKECNRQVVGAAVRLVFATDERQKPFIKKWFGKQPQPRLMDQIVSSLKAAKGPMF